MVKSATIYKALRNLNMRHPRFSKYFVNIIDYVAEHPPNPEELRWLTNKIEQMADEYIEMKNGKLLPPSDDSIEYTT